MCQSSSANDEMMRAMVFEGVSGVIRKHFYNYCPPYSLHFDQASAHLFCSGGGGGGSSLGQMSILKIIIFLMISCHFLVHSYYVVSLNDTN